MFSIGIAPAHPFLMSEQSPRIIKLRQSVYARSNIQPLRQTEIYSILLAVKCAVCYNFYRTCFLMFAYRFDDTVYRLSTVMNFAYTNTEKYGLYKLE